jgi:ketosteroid isomerase-like protein
MEHPNAAAYRQLISRMAEGDTEGIWDALAPDVRWHEAGNPEVIVGREALRDRFAGLENLDGNIDVQAVLANDEHVMAMLQVSLGDPSGDHVEYPVVEVAHMSDGKVTERWAYMDACPDYVTKFFSTLGG